MGGWSFDLLIPYGQQNWVEMGKCFSDDGLPGSPLQQGLIMYCTSTIATESAHHLRVGGGAASVPTCAHLLEHNTTHLGAL